VFHNFASSKTFGWLGCSWKTTGTLWLSWGFNPLQGDPQWPKLVVATKNEPFQKVPLWFGKCHFWGLNHLESANLTQSDRNARQPTVTWSAAPAPAGISRRGMNASRRRFWATLDGLK
jgi:hypothetical protein